MIENTGCEVERVIATVVDTVNEDKLVNDRVRERLQGIFSSSLQYLDSHRDRQVVKALVAEVTSIKFTAELQGISSRQGTTSAKASLLPRLNAYSEIRRTSQTVRSDLTTLQQHLLAERVISARKIKQIKTVEPGRGRKLKTKHYPELSTVLEYAFGELDLEDGGGGLQAHPRLITGTLYRSSDSITTMRKARELLLSLAPQGFKISLSTCYNYTENYRQGSAQAKRHHADRGVNASLSLRRPPRTGVEQLVVNLHWSTANVNHIVDNCRKACSAIISKDAKAIVIGDIAPVQRPGHSWRKRDELPDHTWDQSRTNAVTPMTFLFLQTKFSQSLSDITLPVSQDTIVKLTRTGQAVTLLSLSFYEPETTVRCLNEILLLLSLPALDPFFRDEQTGGLKKEFVFVVDNGPAEQPCNPLVKMCLVRLLNVLQLHKVKQVSFAEYHSKRNFVERVHAEENRVLSKHGPFSSRSVHHTAAPGTKDHRENMEAMAAEVKKCLVQATFGGKPLWCYRGIAESDFLFDDEEELNNFMGLSEEGKLHCSLSYRINRNHILEELHVVWGIQLCFEGNYADDYQLINNTLTKARTSWTDKYTTVLYTPSRVEITRAELQPVPDYLRWLKTCELHYLPSHERKLLEPGQWDTISGLFLPSKILELCFVAIQNPPSEIMKLIALLSWVPVKFAEQYFDKLQNQVTDTINADQEKDKWKNHPLYKQNKKEALVTMCREMKIPATPALYKHQLVHLISQKKGESELSNPLPYTGKLTQIPNTMKGISRFTVGKLRAVLRFHGCPASGCKEQLVLRVYLLRNGQRAAITAREEEEIKDFVSIHKNLILSERRLNLTHHTYHTRAYSTLTSGSDSTLLTPLQVREPSHLSEVYQPLLSYLSQIREQRKEEEEKTAVHLVSPPVSSDNDEALFEQISQVGCKIKVKWAAGELGDSGWTPGWYLATVTGYNSDSDMITLEYTKERGCIYDMELSPAISAHEIKLVRPVI